MGYDSLNRSESIRHNQNALLYSGVKFSAIGSFLASVVLARTFQPIVENGTSQLWMTIVTLVYLARVFDSVQFSKDPLAESRTLYWSKRFNRLALLAAMAWGSAIWLMFPTDNPAYQVLLVLTIGAVAGGALASLPYDNRLSLIFQVILFVSVEAKLLTVGTPFSIEVALYSAFVFGFLMICGAKVGANYIELLRLKQDSQTNNIALIKTTEQMAQMGHWQWEKNNKNVELSENLSKLLGFDKRIVSVVQCLNQVHPDDRYSFRAALINTIKDSATDEEETALEYRLSGNDGSPSRYMRQLIKRKTDTDGAQSFFGSVQDISDIKKAEEKMYRMAYYDSLTELANRGHFHEHLEKYTQVDPGVALTYSVIYIDLDNFKSINDSYGHECGDRYLATFAKHLVKSINRTHFVSRLGGDEFCVLLHGISEQSEIERVASACLSFTDRPIEIGNHRIHPKLSLGIAVYPMHGSSHEQIVKRADTAMYHVKQHGKQSLAFFQDSMEDEALERVRLESDLRKALAEKEFELWYQPKLDTQNNSIAGVEALIRWRHPERGLIPPDLFITTAERVGVIKDIGEWVVITACKQLREWNEQGYELTMAVNVSSEHFASPSFTNFIMKSVVESGISASDFEVEITESQSRDTKSHMEICKILRNGGIRVAIDDFGTGYSSLSVLGDLEADTLKIDKSFIQRIPADQNSKLIVSAITELALSLGYECVAEGVETNEQLQFLKEHGCPYVQGYLCAKPMTADKLVAYLLSMTQVKRAA